MHAFLSACVCELLLTLLTVVDISVATVCLVITLTGLCTFRWHHKPLALLPIGCISFSDWILETRNRMRMRGRKTSLLSPLRTLLYVRFVRWGIEEGERETSRTGTSPDAINPPPSFSPSLQYFPQPYCFFEEARKPSPMIIWLGAYATPKAGFVYHCSLLYTLSHFPLRLINTVCEPVCERLQLLTL